MKYEIIQKSWSKRRQLDKPKKIADIQFLDFLKQHNHFCKMLVSYDDGTEASYIARVIFNDIKQHWVVDGMHVAVRLLD